MAVCEGNKHAWRKVAARRLLGVACVVATAACSSKDNPGPDCAEITTTVTVSYMGNSNAATNTLDPNSIYGITHIYCQGCHASSTEDRRGAPLEVVFDTYNDTVQWGLASDETMASNQMPPPPAVLEQAIICTFDNWVDQNYPP